MKLFVIFLGALIWLLLYAYVCKKHRSAINFFTPTALTMLPKFYILEMMYLGYFINTYSDWSYIYIYICYSVAFTSFVFGFFCSTTATLKVKPLSPSQSKLIFFALLFTVFSFIFFSPILIAFKSYIFTPRVIYEKTRTGYGVYFFTSILFSQLAIIFLFYTYKKNKIISLFLILLNIILIYLHGVKSPLFTLAVNYFIYGRYVEKKIISFSKFFILASILSVGIIFVFMLTFRGSVNTVFASMAYYADYTRNYALLIDREQSSYWGRLLFESEVFARLPRVIYPDKPLDFGYLILDRKYFPESFYDNKGVPSFGMGEYFADFGYLSVFFIMVSFWIKGCFLRIFYNTLKKDDNVYIYIPFAFLCGANLLPLGYGWMFWEHCIISVLIYFMFKFSFGVKYRRSL
ncbi:oligosaccharide repeat unit polymerase [Klebsiella pneumoniae]|uniref:oligosaccharide repeat unit polymerase n=1 Tax=Klebsiella TaxID=570 RepID=UPI001124D4DD|nr:oligosaccharide repeat unit polymerase [Klebsiella quasipneumoniae]MBD7308981.1 oligosaccharide repeat unit polymerase [Klebsiella pneumoniae]MBD7314441.1 oligosaccharide repeat unit polymerase [Klebsiella pneumoniae]MBK2842618.1 oligosaccharide repeat unit polymerase [Klebsiella pneumoniae]HBR1696345.1 oligosaccharide repeat unit polymerase [Klebsiella quasipneumoniae subsp. quasipneumoniae]